MKIIITIVIIWLIYLSISLKDLSDTYVYTSTKQIKLNNLIIDDIFELKFKELEAKVNKGKG